MAYSVEVSLRTDSGSSLHSIVMVADLLFSMIDSRFSITSSRGEISHSLESRVESRGVNHDGARQQLLHSKDNDNHGRLLGV
jgi:hypothetical protein